MDNKPKPSRLGKLLFSLVCAILLGYLAWSADKRDEPLSPTVFIPLLIGIGTGLEIEFTPFLSALQQTK